MNVAKQINKKKYNNDSWQHSKIKVEKTPRRLEIKVQNTINV